MRKTYSILYVAVMTAFLFFPTTSQTVQSNFPDVNGTIEGLASVGSTVYLSGSFSYVAPFTGMGVALNTGTGNPNTAFPQFNATFGTNGGIRAIAPDGAGGFYVGGSFDRINGAARNNLARVNSDGSLNSWNPNPSSWVNSISVSADNNTVYIGGGFNQVNSTSRYGVAAIQASDGALTSWNASLTGGEVFAVSVSTTGTIFVGGDFNASSSGHTIGGQSRNRLAEISTSTGLATSWNPNVSSNFSQVNAIVQSSGSVYIGGYFFTLGASTARLMAAKIAKGTGTLNASWDPSADFFVNAMALSGDKMYIGGSFATIGGASSYGLAAVDTTNGTAISTWLPNADGNVYALAVSGTTLYVGGDFKTIGGSSRIRFASINISSLSSVTVNSLNYGFGRKAAALSVVGTTLYVGGEFQMAGGSVRNGIAAIDGTTGAVLSWDPNPPAGADIGSMVISADNNSMYVGGLFSSIGGQTRNNLAKISLATGLADATWDPNVDADIGKMALSPTGDTLYFYGGFNNVNGSTARHNVAAVKTTGTGVATTFDPGGPGATTTRLIIVSPDGNYVYIGFNSFNETVGGSTASYFAALNAADGTLAAMTPGFNQGAFAAAIVGTDFYIGGQFTQTTIGENTIQKIAKFDASSGWGNPQLVTSWNNTSATRPDGDIRAIIYSNTAASPLLYLGGGFSNLGATARRHYGAINASDLAVQSWDVAETGGVGGLDVRMLLSTGTQKIYIGDDVILSMAGTNRLSLAAVTGGTDPLPVELVSFTGMSDARGSTLRWSTATEVNNYGFEVEKAIMNDELGIKNWSKMGFVEGSGTTNAPKEYSFTDKNITAGKYSYRLKQIDRNGSFTYSKEISIDVGAMPRVFLLSQNYPNPFNPTTDLRFTIADLRFVSLKVYDVLGKEVVTLVNESLSPGTYSVRWDATNSPSGVYFARLVSGESRLVRKLMLMK